MQKVKVLFPSLEFNEWPKTTKALCLYCSEPCPSQPIPKVCYYNVKNDQFNIQGFFCRPCCALGQIKETTHGGEGDRSYIWTQVFLKRYFGVKDFVCAPPKTALQKYGGDLTLKEFYGNSDFEFTMTSEAPFVNSYSIHEFTSTRIHTVDGRKDEDTLTRPTIRTEPQSEQSETGFPPMLLEYLAKQQEKQGTHEKKEVKKQNSESLLKFMKKAH